MVEASNRQLVARRRGTTGPVAELGVVWGRGALEENIEDAGALALVLTALARELERPVQLDDRRTGAVRATLEVEPDLCGIRLTGRPELLRAAAQRLPHLFGRPLVAEGLAPLPLDGPHWRADLLARTGANGFTVQGLEGLGTGARHTARRLLRELDVRHGTVNCLLWTDDASLLGAADGFAPLRPAPHEPAWADGTARWRPGSAPAQRDGNRPALFGAGRPRELISVMVPRTLEGRAVGELLRIALAESLAAAGDEHEMISLEAQGMGEGMRLVLSTRTPLRHEQRPAVLSELLRRIGLLPDSWIAAVLHSTASPAWLERGRRVRGLGRKPEATVDGVRSALEDARSSLHLALDPQLLDFAAHPQLSAMPEHTPASRDPQESPRIFAVSRRGKRSGGSHPATRVRLTRTTLAVEGGSSAREPAIVDLEDLACVIESPSGARQLIDRAGGSVTVRTKDLEEGQQLETYLGHRLARVPRLLREDQGPRTHPGVLQRRQSLAMLLALGAAGAMIVLFGVMPALDDAAEEESSQEAWSRLRPDWGETAELSNGSRITASAPVVEQDVHRITVTFCAGADTEGLGSDGEEADEMVQNIVRPDDFSLFTDSGGALPLVEGPPEAEDLPSDWLEDGECATGDLRFERMGAEGSGLLYTNSFGDRVDWKAR